MKKYTSTLLPLSLLVPAIASAQQLDNLGILLDSIRVLVFNALPVAMGLAVLAFLWGLAKFIYKSGDTKAQEEGKNIMKWGIIALFVLTSAWGIISFIGGEIGIGQGGDFDFPQVNL